jgi:hypothetical protein
MNPTGVNPIFPHLHTTTSKVDNSAQVSSY